MVKIMIKITRADNFKSSTGLYSIPEIMNSYYTHYHTIIMMIKIKGSERST